MCSLFTVIDIQMSDQSRSGRRSKDASKREWKQRAGQVDSDSDTESPPGISLNAPSNIQNQSLTAAKEPQGKISSSSLVSRDRAKREDRKSIMRTKDKRISRASKLKIANSITAVQSAKSRSTLTGSSISKTDEISFGKSNLSKLANNAVGSLRKSRVLPKSSMLTAKGSAMSAGKDIMLQGQQNKQQGIDEEHEDSVVWRGRFGFAKVVSPEKQAKYDLEQSKAVLDSIRTRENVILEQERAEIALRRSLTDQFNDQLTTAVQDTFQQVTQALTDLVKNLKLKQGPNGN